jgi:hypothetical protein
VERQAVIENVEDPRHGRQFCSEGLTGRQPGAVNHRPAGTNFARAGQGRNGVIDNFALGLIHLLLGIAIWKLLLRPDLDRDPDEPQTPVVPTPVKPRPPQQGRR